jgi:hypothetical protein
MGGGTRQTAEGRYELPAGRKVPIPQVELLTQTSDGPRPNGRGPSPRQGVGQSADSLARIRSLTVAASA